MYTTIIFDFFGVIRQDPTKLWLGLHGLDPNGPFRPIADQLDFGHMSMDEYYESLGQLSGQTAEEVAHEFADPALVSEGLPEFIKELGSNYTVGLLSNAHSDYLRPIMATHGYDELFEQVVISEEIGLMKPDPEAFQTILTMLNARPEVSIFIDDNLHNVTAAEQLGMSALQYIDLDQLKADLAELGIMA